jgi:hypothetical protein
MLEAFKALLQSRKTIAALLATAAATVLCAAGKLPVTELAHFVGALTGVLILAIAAEDAALKHNPEATRDLEPPKPPTYQ